MNAGFQRRIQRYGWDKAVDYYERSWQKQLFPAQKRLLELADLREGERVLDVACGTGLVTFPAAASVGVNGKVVGSDISQGMVNKAGEIAAAQNLRQIEFKRMDGEDLQFPDASFDVVLCALGLLYFPDPLKSLQEMYRVIKPGGRLVAAVWGERRNCGWADIFPIVDSRVNSEVCPMFFFLGGQDILRRHFEMAGFENVASERLSSTLHYHSSEEALGAAFAGGPVALAYSRFDEQTREEAHRDYLTSIARYRNGKGYHIPGEFVVASGQKSNNRREATS